MHSHRPICTVLLLLLMAALLSCSKPTNWKDLPWVEHYQTGIAQAQRLNRPVLIYFQAKWCSWCHIYERDTLSHQTVTHIIRQRYVPVLVNYDARPDLLRRFGGFGLPYTVIVSPEGELLARLPGILSPEDLTDTLTRIAEGKSFQHSLVVGETTHTGQLDQTDFQHFQKTYLSYLNDLFDEETDGLTGHLGTGAGLKRPSPMTWSYLMQQGLWPERTRRAANTIYRRLYDPIDGGFFYFLDPHRTDEHLETSKLLEATAWLSSWLADAGTRYQQEDMIAAARAGVDYMQQTLWDTREGGLFQAQFSDPEYYALDKQTRSRRSAPELETLKRIDTNAQAAFALIQIGDQLSEIQTGTMAHDLASKTIDYLLQQHYRKDKLYHSRQQAKFGPAVNLPEDIFWLLAAAQEVQRVRPDMQRQQQLQAITALANLWLDREIKKGPAGRHSVELLGLIALVTANDSQQYPAKATQWALKGIRIEPTTQPDELVFALRAWEQLLVSRKSTNRGQQ